MTDADVTPEVIGVVHYGRKFYATPRKAAEAIFDVLTSEPSVMERFPDHSRARVIRYTHADDGRGGDLTDAARAAVQALPDRPARVPHPLDLRVEFTREIDQAYDEWMKADRKWRKAAIVAIEKSLDLR